MSGKELYLFRRKIREIYFHVGFLEKSVFFFYIKVQNWQHGIQSLVLKTGAASSPVHQIPWVSGFHILSGASIPLYDYLCARPSRARAGRDTVQGSLPTLPVSVLLSPPEVWGRLGAGVTDTSRSS